MDRELNKTIELCASLVSRIGADDLTSLAHLHGELQSIANHAGEPAVSSAARQAAALVEQLVRGMSDQPAETFRQVAALVEAMRAGGNKPAKHNGTHRGWPVPRHIDKTNPR